jgi:hypothetical protein
MGMDMGMDQPSGYLVPDAVVPQPGSSDMEDFNGDIVEEWGKQSFPASDPPANW